MGYYITDKCFKCGACAQECVVDAITIGNIYKIDESKCIKCGVCKDICPVQAIIKHPNKTVYIQGKRLIL